MVDGMGQGEWTHWDHAENPETRLYCL
jgi:hypothetical protein